MLPRTPAKRFNGDGYLDDLRAVVRANASALLADIALNHDRAGTGFIDAATLAMRISERLGLSADDIALLLANEGNVFQPSPSGRVMTQSSHEGSVRLRPVIKVRYRDLVMMGSPGRHRLRGRSPSPSFPETYLAGHSLTSSSSASSPLPMRRPPFVLNTSAPAPSLSSPHLLCSDHGVARRPWVAVVLRGQWLRGGTG